MKPLGKPKAKAPGQKKKKNIKYECINLVNVERQDRMWNIYTVFV